MNVLDLILVVILIGSLIRGYQMGLIRQVINFLGFFIALFIAYRFSGDLAPYIESVIPTPSFEQSTLYMFSETFQLTTMFYNSIAFFIIFIMTKLLLQIGGAVLHQIASLPVLATINRFSGALLGFIQAFIMVLIILHIMSVMPTKGVQDTLNGSYTAKLMMNVSPIVTEALYELWNETEPTTTVLLDTM